MTHKFIILISRTPAGKVFLAPNDINDKQISLDLSQLQVRQESDISATLVAHILCSWITYFLISQISAVLAEALKGSLTSWSSDRL